MACSDDEYYTLEASESVEDDESVSAQSVTHDVVTMPKDREDARPMSYDNDARFTNGKRGRGVVHVFNNYKFTSKNLSDFKDGREDGRRLRRVFTTLSYKVKVWKNLSKKETDDAFLKIQRTKGLSKEFSLVIFILSHGSDENTFFSSDGEPINLMKRMALFRKDHCPAMKIKPLILFGDFCRGDGSQRGTGPFVKKSSSSQESITYYGKKEALANMQYVMSSNPGFVSLTDGKGNSCFTNEVCSMLSEKKYQQHPLNNQWFGELTRRMRVKKCPSPATYTFHPFPGSLFHVDDFSFRFDLKKIAERSGRKVKYTPAK